MPHTIVLVFSPFLVDTIVILSRRWELVTAGLRKCISLIPLVDCYKIVVNAGPG